MAPHYLLGGHGLFFIWSVLIDLITVDNLYGRILVEEAGHFGQVNEGVLVRHS